VDLKADTDILEEHTASIFSLKGGGSGFLQNVDLPSSPHGVTTQKTNIDMMLTKLGGTVTDSVTKWFKSHANQV
jgi:hypothetical protein